MLVYKNRYSTETSLYSILTKFGPKKQTYLNAFNLKVFLKVTDDQIAPNIIIILRATKSFVC